MSNYTIIFEKLVTATIQPPPFSCYFTKMITFFFDLTNEPLFTASTNDVSKENKFVFKKKLQKVFKVLPL